MKSASASVGNALAEFLLDFQGCEPQMFACMELSLPAKDLKTGIVAFENGADSIYFGLERFSARASAVNFSIEDYRRIRKYALEHGKRIFIAFNTIITDDELQKAFEMLSIISLVGCDGLLVQDWGVVRLVKRFFPDISLHGSTQMAIQNSSGVSVLHKFGFKRAVLARELSLDEIAVIRKGNPDIELKVFIHGALCYCISGLCYMSRKLMGKGSGNRGGCVQGCRFGYETANGRRQTPFSLKDLISDGGIMDRLADIGIDSVKVEGRLKSESYVKWASRYYRALLNHDSDAWVSDCKARMQAAYSRDCSSGYFYPDNLKSGNIRLNGYQGHRGCICGRFIDSKSIMLTQPLGKHDGLMFLDSKGFPHKFANLKGAFKRNSIVRLDSLTSEKADIPKDSLLYKIKDSRDNSSEGFNAQSIEMQSIDLDMRLTIFRNRVSIRAVLPFGKQVSLDCAADVQIAKTLQNASENLNKAFSRKTEWCRLGSLEIVNDSGIDMETLFLPSSAMKRISGDFFSRCEAEIMSYLSRQIPDDDLYGDFKAEPDRILSPVAFCRNAADASVFTDSIVEINNLSDLDCLIDDSGKVCRSVLEKIKGVVLGPYLNIANRQALLFFKDIFGDKLVGAVSFVEGGTDEDFKNRLIDGEKLFEDRRIPLYIKREADGKFLMVRKASSDMSG